MMKNSIAKRAITIWTLFPICNAAPTNDFQKDIAFTSPSNTRSLLRTRQDYDSVDIGDQSWVRSYTALGDSFASGIGAGSRLKGSGDWGCSRYDASYPALINSDERLGDPSTRAFSFLACSGAVTDDVVKKQIPAMPSDQDLITLSIGGNDLGLVDILNECIFQWYSFYRPGPAFSFCGTQLAKAQATLDDPAFADKLRSVADMAVQKLSGNGTVYWTGYPHLFGTDDNQCDEVSWSFWKAWPFYQYLTLDRRQTMNGLVDQLNTLIVASAASTGGRVQFVDYAPVYDRLSARFCEAGWAEDDPQRIGLALFEWYTYDDQDGDNLQPRQDSPSYPVVNGTFEGDINNLIIEYLQKNDPNDDSDQTTLLYRPAPLNSDQSSTGSLSFAPYSNSTLRTRRLQSRQQVTGDISSYRFTQDQLDAGLQLSIVPDGYGRIIHPRIYGHVLVSNMVLYNMAVTKAEQNGIPGPDQEIDPDVCPVGEGALGATTPPETPPSLPAQTSSPFPLESPSPSGEPPAGTAAGTDSGTAAGTSTKAPPGTSAGASAGVPAGTAAGTDSGTAAAIPTPTPVPT